MPDEMRTLDLALRFFDEAPLFLLLAARFTCDAANVRHERLGGEAIVAI